MENRTITALKMRLGPYVGLSKSRLETLFLLVLGVLSARTVNLSHVACERGGAVQGRAREACLRRRLMRATQAMAVVCDNSHCAIGCGLG